MGVTKIEWTRGDDGSPGRTWNPLVGCSKVSPGCTNCYAKTMHERFNGPGSFDTVTLHPDRLGQPLRWRKPARVFVNSMSDLFHQDVPDAYIDSVFGVMAANLSHDQPTHTFQLLTKRHARMRSYLSAPDVRARIALAAAQRTDEDHCDATHDYLLHGATWPLPNVWLGVSVEDQKWAGIRIPPLLDTPAAVRFLSAEPLLGPVQLCRCDGAAYGPQSHPFLVNDACPLHGTARIDWVIVGGESGPGARPMRVEWATSLRDQCVAAGAAFMFKQAGTVLAREWGGKGKGGDPAHWPETFPREYPHG